MQLSTAIRQRIVNLCIDRNISLNQLAQAAGITYSTLNSFLNGKSNDPKMSTILHLCEGLNIQIYEFFKDDLFLDAIFE
mgnify:CR=1 FL=1